ncbi:MAG: lipopolysaccharide biosynthesis protein [Oscillibacter sp.]|nr:lipopolysaccharide biosynthesis protein [Oscillibacter sp.]
MAKSRTEYSARNTTVSMLGRMITILMGFCTRVVFTHTLSQEYVGVNGLFSDILCLLSISELGAGTAITYALYRPIAEGDIEKQKSLMCLFRQLYRIVAGIILVGGLLILPFMDVLIKDTPEIDHLNLIYLLYLCNSVLSYTVVYKRTLVDAHQLSYIGVLCQTAAGILQGILQITVLLTSRNFVLFVSIISLSTLLSNAAISIKADQLYPYLRDRDVQKLPEEERREIFQNTWAMLMHKTGKALVNHTDNLLLSSLVGIISNSLYSNYYLIICAINEILKQAFQGITASVGNLGVETNKKRVHRIFETTFFLSQWMHGLAVICLYELIDPFVSLFFGPTYVFTKDVTLVLCLNFYLTGMRQPTLVFRDSLGIFWYDRYKSLVEAAINLVASILLGQRLGTVGIFLGTLLSIVTTSLWVEPLMLYRHFLESSVWPYFRRYGLYTAVTFLLWYGEDLVCRRITGAPWGVCMKRLAVCVVVTNLVYWLLYHRMWEFRLLMEKGRGLLSQYRKST